MAKLIAEAIALQEDMELCPYGLSEGVGTVFIESESPIQLVPIEEHAYFLKARRRDVDLIVDFTVPRSVNLNSELYREAEIPFVMGTTGETAKRLVEIVQMSTISAVIATNFAAPVVMFQAMIRFAAKTFPNSLNGFTLLIRESHQASKPDVSGTAESLLDAFKEVGMPLKKEQIIMVRDPVVQEAEMGIPKQYLSGHGYHTYTFLSADGTVKLQFIHNVLGRSVYVDGALKAIRFLHLQHAEGKVFSMIDVLRG